MARFRGTVNGGRTTATRLGHAKGGLQTEAQSYQGKVVVELYAKGVDDWAKVFLDQHEGSGTKSRVIYDGPVRGF